MTKLMTKGLFKDIIFQDNGPYNILNYMGIPIYKSHVKSQSGHQREIIHQCSTYLHNLM